jgi:membrane protein implicated in regulation of membrane protease activity
MNPQTAKTVTWAALFCLLTGMLIISPSAAFLLYSLAAILAVLPAVMAGTWLRVTALFLLALSLFLAFDAYPKFSKEMKMFRTKTLERKGSGL